MPALRYRFSARRLLGAAGGLMAGALLLAQGRFYGGGGQVFVAPSTRTAREIESRSTGTPM